MFRILLLAFTASLFSFPTFAQDEFHYYLYGSSEQKGILNKEGVPLTDCIYHYIGSCSEGLIPVRLDDKYSFIDTLGKAIFPFRYDYADEFKDGTAIVCMGDKYGLIDRKGAYLIEPLYDGFVRIADKKNQFVVERYNKSGIIDSRNQILVPLEYEVIYAFEKGNAVAKKNGLHGLIDTKGNVLIDFQYPFLSTCVNGYSVTYSMEENGKKGLMDMKKRILIPADYKRLYAAEDGFVYGVGQDGYKDVVWDKKGKPIIGEGYDKVERFSEGFFLVVKDSKSGFLDKSGKVVIPLIYEEAKPFSEGLAAVLKDGYWGFIDKKGATAIDFKFVGVVEGFYKGYASYGKRATSSGAHYTSDLWGIIDKKGNIVLENKYYNAGIQFDGKFVVESGGKTYLLDKSTNVIRELMHEQRPVMMMGD
ncbi:WG repeat-containing protein [Sphingobacterium yanglingense]|uniref:WG repeat protein n=1 Tax=Sphingobacterium yanglingense TaxID=1437280 RepID=A0A4R6WMK2_9SPHI|nr:WG repeat-containing protein [Sphingobacterium yanglingense]TDQ80058.1 WG repeat protein [Sphingobacterium yanglingense]